MFTVNGLTPGVLPSLTEVMTSFHILETPVNVTTSILLATTLTRTIKPDKRQFKRLGL